MQLLEEEKIYKDKLIDHYYFCANETEKYWQRDNEAALKIQSVFRMYVKRKQFLKMKAAAIKIETLWRAYFAHKTFQMKKKKDQNEKNLQYFARQAINIQRVFRGFYVRKYVHNFYLRKQELRALERKNQQFRKQLDQFGKAEARQSEDYKRELARAEFSALAKNLHHLTSTKNIPGVYNSPFAIQKPSVFEKTVEDHLSENFHETYKWRPPKRQQIMKYSIKSGKQVK